VLFPALVAFSSFTAAITGAAGGVVQVPLGAGMFSMLLLLLLLESLGAFGVGKALNTGAGREGELDLRLLVRTFFWMLGTGVI
jgi:hypothetical protein